MPGHLSSSKLTSCNVVKGEIMENTIRFAFASQRNVPNKRLAAVILRVENKYNISSTELDDEVLGLVSAAGEQNVPLSQKEDGDE